MIWMYMDWYVMGWMMCLTLVFIACHVLMHHDDMLMFIACFYLIYSVARRKLCRLHYLRMKQAKTSLEQAIASEDLSALDSAIELAIEFDVPPGLIASAKQVRRRIYEISQAKRALISALHSKDTQLMETALQSAKNIGLDIQTCDEMMKVQQLLTLIRNHMNQLKQAMDKRDMEGLIQGLGKAQELQMDGQLENQARILYKRLQEGNRWG